MKRIRRIFILSLLIALIAVQAPGCANQKTDKEILISVAASLQDCVNEIKDNYSKTKPEVKVVINYGSSGTLQNQIEQGAPVDIFISAGKSQMDSLENKNLLLEDTRINLLGNQLVLVTAKDNNDINKDTDSNTDKYDDKVTSLSDLNKSEIKQIGVATPTTVPAGEYTQEALSNLGYWESLQPKFVFAKDVKQVLAYVETRNVDAGFVYLSDAKTSDKVDIMLNVPENLHATIIYPAAVTTDTKNKEAAKDFMEYLQGSEAKQVFVKYGFKTLR